MRPEKRALLSSALQLAVTAGAPAITFNITYDASVDSFTNGAQVKSACTYVAQTLQNVISDPITVNITVVALDQPGVLGESQSSLIGAYTFDDIHAALASHAATADDAAALATLTTDPTGGAPFYLATAQAKALGLLGPSSDSDGTFYFGTQLPYAYDPARRSVPGEYDFIGVAFHEFTEVMGRIPLLGPQYGLHDLFRYSAPGVRAISSSGGGVWFSVDGVNLVKEYNNADANGGDPDDWASQANDAFNAFSGTGENVLSSIDLRVMDAIGFSVLTCGPAYTSQPTAQSACPGATATFTAATASPTDTFAWQINGIPLTDGPTGTGSAISGSATSTLVISNVGQPDANIYTCIATNSCTSTFSFGVALSINNSPVVTVQPVPLAVCPGFPAVIGVFVNASPAPAYLWRRSGVPLSDGPTGFGSAISGSASSQLIISNVQPGDLVTYDCVISNVCGSATTDAVALSQGSNPQITGQPAAATACRTNAASFTIQTTGGPPDSFQWQWFPPHGSSTLTVVDGANTNPSTGLTEFTAAGSRSPTLSLTNFANTAQNGSLIGIACRLDNACGTTFSDFASLLVCPADFNCDGHVTVQDVFDYLAAWFSRSPNADFNNSGSVTVQDIFDFLRAWFAGGC